MSDFEVIQELKNRVSVLEEENKLLKEFVEMVENGNVDLQSVVQLIKKEEKFKKYRLELLIWLK